MKKLETEEAIAKNRNQAQHVRKWEFSEMEMMYHTIVRASERPHYQPHDLTDEDRTYSRFRLLKRAAKSSVLALEPDFGGTVGAALAAKRVPPVLRVPRMSVGPASRERSTADPRPPSPPPANLPQRMYLRSAPRRKCRNRSSF